MPCKFPLKWYAARDSFPGFKSLVRVVIVQAPNTLRWIEEVQPGVNLADPNWSAKACEAWYREITFTEACEILGYVPDLKAIIKSAKTGDSYTSGYSG